MTKKELRIKFQKLRESLNTETIEEFSITIASRALLLPIWNKENYHVYLNIEALKEPQTTPLLSILQGKDKNIIISKANFKNNSMNHYLLTDNTVIQTNHYGIPEPQNGIKIPEEQIDVVFVPLLAFDQNGNRVGYGKGFYDRFLKKCRKDCLKIGLSFFEISTEISDINEKDIPLDYCITPYQTYSFNN